MQQSDRKLRVGIIGTGIFALKAHLPALKALADQFEVVACCNRTKEKADTFAKAAGINADRVFTDYNALLDLADVDAVIVAIPVELNLEVAKAAIAKNKHVFMEKPIASNLADAAGIVALGDANPHRILAIAENYPHKTIIIEMAESIARGEIGDVLSFELSSQREFDPTNPYLLTQWRQDAAHIGGYLSDGGVHWTAMILATLGHVRSVAARTRHIHKLNGTDDSLALVFEMTSGVIGTWHQTYAGTTSYSNFTVTGNKGTLVANNLESFEIKRKGDVVKYYSFEKVGAAPTASQDIIAEFADFYAAVRRLENSGASAGAINDKKGEEGDEDFVMIEKKGPRVSLRDAYHHFAIICAAVTSARETHKFENVSFPAPLDQE